MKGNTKLRSARLLAGALTIVFSLVVLAGCSTDSDGGGGNSVVNVAVTGVEIDAGISLTVGQSLKLSAAISPENATNKAVKWASNNTRIATAGDDGTITGIATGTAVIIVTTADGGKLRGNMGIEQSRCSQSRKRHNNSN
jgi:uncharacterized protein YjdB